MLNGGFNKRNVIVLILIAAVTVSGVLIWNWKFKIRYQSDEFVGVVEKVQGDTISLKGVYVVPDNYEASVLADKKSVSVTIAADTKFIKTFIFLPTEEELKKTGGWYKADDLKREVSAGTIEDIRPDESVSGFSIRVKSSENVYGRSLFIASEIGYTIPVYK